MSPATHEQQGSSISILFVCMGNICRSPAAEGIMIYKIHKQGLAHRYRVDSAGTYGGHAGEPADHRMRTHAEKRGYKLESRSRKFYPEADFEQFDLIIAMDEQNYEDLKRMAKNREELEKICKMTDFSMKLNYQNVPDPYYGGESGFEIVLDILEDAIDGLLEKTGINV